MSGTPFLPTSHMVNGTIYEVLVLRFTSHELSQGRIARILVRRRRQREAEEAVAYVLDPHSPILGAVEGVSSGQTTV